MNGTVGGVIVSISASTALSIVVKATIVLGIALLATRLARHARASLRHALLASAFAVLVVLPAFTMLLPRLEIPIVRLDAQESPSMPVGVGVAQLSDPH